MLSACFSASYATRNCNNITSSGDRMRTCNNFIAFMSTRPTRRTFKTYMNKRLLISLSFPLSRRYIFTDNNALDAIKIGDIP